MSKAYVIDIGTNSVRLMLAEIAKDKVTSLYKRLITTRLGEAARKDGTLNFAGAMRTADAVSEFYTHAKSENAQFPVYVFATSAARDAKNSHILTDAIFERTGLKTDILSGCQEAQIGYLGAVSAGFNALIDVGGGSTEIATGENGKKAYYKSYDIGAVRARKLFGKDAKSTYDYASSLFTFPTITQKCCALGGTATTAAAMLQNLTTYDPIKVHGYVLTEGALEELYNKVASADIEERLKMPGLPAQRADIIPHGLAILLSAMRRAGLKEITVSEADNLEGYLLLRTL